jgi:hypothetical protein
MAYGRKDKDKVILELSPQEALVVKLVLGQVCGRHEPGTILAYATYDALDDLVHVGDAYEYLYDEEPVRFKEKEIPVAWV